MIIDRCRDYEEFKKFFKKYPMNDGIFSYDFVKNNPHLYCAYDETNGDLKAYANMYLQDNKLYISGASMPKNLPNNINFIIKICDAFGCNVYADTDKKPAKIVLKKAGFKKISNDIYVRYKNGL